MKEKHLEIPSIVVLLMITVSNDIILDIYMQVYNNIDLIISVESNLAYQSTGSKL